MKALASKGKPRDQNSLTAADPPPTGAPCPFSPLPPGPRVAGPCSLDKGQGQARAQQTPVQLDETSEGHGQGRVASGSKALQTTGGQALGNP